jgi:diaminopimelate decarboxylase
MPEIEKLRFLTPEIAKKIADQFGTPAYVYDEATMIDRAKQALGFPVPFGLTVHYSMKANANTEILRLFDKQGIHIDASSGFEAERAIKAGINPKNILLTTQETPKNLKRLVELGVKFNASSLHQLETYGKLFPSTDISIRTNPKVGSGFNNRLSTGGANASFGIWVENLNKAKKIIEKYKLTLIRIHNHIGTGGDPDLWGQTAIVGLDSVRQFPSVTIFNLGGGFKAQYMQGDKTTRLHEIGKIVGKKIKEFAKETGRKIHLEIEPGHFLVTEAGAILSKIQDISDTGKDGHEFIKLDTGLSEITRIAMFGAKHPIVIINNSDSQKEYIVVGHSCETSDTLTLERNNPEKLQPRWLSEAKIGDLVAIERAGGHCASFTMSNYNSFPIAPEVLVKADGTIKLIRRRQTLEEMLELEV